MPVGIAAAVVGIGSAIMGKRSSKKAAKQAKAIGKLNAQIEGMEAKDRAIARLERLNSAIGAQSVSFAARGIDVGSLTPQAMAEADTEAFKREQLSDDVRTQIQQKAFRKGAQARARSISTEGTMNLLSSVGTFIGAIK